MLKLNYENIEYGFGRVFDIYCGDIFCFAENDGKENPSILAGWGLPAGRQGFFYRQGGQRYRSKKQSC